YFLFLFRLFLTSSFGASVCGTTPQPQAAPADRKLARDDQDLAPRVTRHIPPGVFPRPPRTMGQPVYPGPGDDDRGNGQAHKRPRVRDGPDAMAKGAPASAAEYM